MKFDTITLVTMLGNLNSGHIRYDIGPGIGKVSDLSGTEPAAIHSLDCSGFVQYVIYKATSFNVKIPQGSVKQKDWLLANSYARIGYPINAPKLDNCVRIGFRAPIPEKPATRTTPKVKKKVGHVWLVINGKTYESTKKNGNDGPASLLWSQRTSEADHFFVLGLAPDFYTTKMSFPWPF